MRISEMIVSSKTERYLKQLYYKKEADRQLRKLAAKRIRMTVAVTVISLTVSVPVFIADHDRLAKPVSKLLRNEDGEGSRSVTVKAVTGDGYEEKMTIEIEERQYTAEELEGFSRKLDGVLWDEILAENSDADNVTKNLDLKNRIEGYPFEISWRTDMPQILSAKGEIDRKKLIERDNKNEGIGIQLCATLKYKDHIEDKYSYVTVKCDPENPGENIKNTIASAIEASDKKSRNSKNLDLPENAGGKRIGFYPVMPNKGWLVLLTGVVTVCLCTAAKDNRIKEKADERRKQIEDDYTRILNQYALYHTAGMNSRAIWSAICKRYEETLAESEKNRRYAYDEMVNANRMMDEGEGELNAYDVFANRCESVGFRSFISFVKQAVVKGNDGLDGMLYEQIDKARSEKTARVKIRASEAETKLLLPMFMMLTVVLVTVMVPALMGLQD